MNKDQLIKKIAKIKGRRSMGYSVLFSCFMICCIYSSNWNPYCVYAIALPLGVSLWLLRPGPEAELIEWFLMLYLETKKGGESRKNKSPAQL